MGNPSDSRPKKLTPRRKAQGKTKGQKAAPKFISLAGFSSPPIDAKPISIVPPTIVESTSLKPSHESSSSRPLLGVQKANSDGGGADHVNASPSKGLKKREGRRSLSCDHGDHKSKRQDVDDAGLPAICAVCNRKFPSHRALFGHLRTHSKKEWGGAFPPPKCNPDRLERGSSSAGQRQQLRQQPPPTQKTLENITSDAKPSKKLVFDLNFPPQEDPSTQEKVQTVSGFDLNLPPPIEDNDDYAAPA